MNQLLRFLIVLLPIVVLIFFGKILLVDEGIKFSNFNSKIFPEFQLNDLDGNPVQSGSLNGVKILNVWASWCITCLVEHPFLTRLSEQNIQIIGLNYKDSDLKANAWLKKHGNPYLFSIYDPRGDLAFDLGVTGAPESYLIVNNQVVGHIQGEMNQRKWETIFLPLIQKAIQGS
ncbi:DsbE family thiol:disulfide interchange protein [Gammaproteobacteria bacterium]|nr:DsbE family thiol:disulfide interchange protein [Gammaproteobacteria bacterium]MDA9800464.1 DsbE family thiol:disulfide interchange protein [Gammaproteobacteria bacterium]